jgi:hypothetical protein
VEVAVADELGVDRDPGGLQRGAVAVDARAAAEHRRRAADHADAPMAELEQVAGRHQAAVPVRRPDGRHVGRRLAGGVDDDERDAPCVEPRRLLLGELGDHEDHAGGAPRGDRVDPRAPEGARALLG